MQKSHRNFFFYVFLSSGFSRLMMGFFIYAAALLAGFLYYTVVGNFEILLIVCIWDHGNQTEIPEHSFPYKRLGNFVCRAFLLTLYKCCWLLFWKLTYF